VQCYLQDVIGFFPGGEDGGAGDGDG